MEAISSSTRICAQEEPPPFHRPPLILFIHRMVRRPPKSIIEDMTRIQRASSEPTWVTRSEQVSSGQLSPPLSGGAMKDRRTDGLTEGKEKAM